MREAVLQARRPRTSGCRRAGTDARGGLQATSAGRTQRRDPRAPGQLGAKRRTCAAWARRGSGGAQLPAVSGQDLIRLAELALEQALQAGGGTQRLVLQHEVSGARTFSLMHWTQHPVGSQSTDTNAAQLRPQLEGGAWSALKHLVEERGSCEAPPASGRPVARAGDDRAARIRWPDVLEELTRILEEQVDGMASDPCSCPRIGSTCGTVPRPACRIRYRRAIDGVAIGPRAGSCGTAAFLGRPVIVTDIARDPLWTDYKDRGPRSSASERAGRHRSCLRAANVLGTFAMYHRQPFTPSSMHLQPDRSGDEPRANRDRARRGRT